MKAQIKRDEEQRIARLEKMIRIHPSDSEFLKEEDQKEREKKMKGSDE